MSGLVQLRIIAWGNLCLICVTIAFDLLGFILSPKPVWLARMAAQCVLALVPYFLLKGSDHARKIFGVLSFIGFVSSGAIYLLLPNSLIFLPCAVYGGLCFFWLFFSSELRSELEKRATRTQEERRIREERELSDLKEAERQELARRNDTHEK